MSKTNNSQGEQVIDLTLTRNLRNLTRNPNLIITPAPAAPIHHQTPPPENNRRVLRPRESKSYAETPDIVILGPNKNTREFSSDSDENLSDVEMPVVPIKELSAAEIWERDRKLKRLREELLNEEAKLVLFKKLKAASQSIKENVSITPSSLPTTATLPNIPATINKTSLSVTPAPPALIPTNRSSSHSHHHGKPASMLTSRPGTLTNSISSRPSQQPQVPLLQQQHHQHQHQPIARPTNLPGGITLTTGVPANLRNIHTRNRPNLTITPSVTITPASVPPQKNRNVQPQSAVSIIATGGSNSVNDSDRLSSRGDMQTPAEKQAAAKMALRKQLEKTLLQIPPPKPPTPKMNFIPNPSNTEFVYLLGLEYVVDYLVKDKKHQPVQQPLRCSQCKVDFTPLWTWEKQGKKGNPTFQSSNSSAKVLCENCVTTNVKKALKAEHTNRLKTAFVKALQQEQEIEQRIANQSVSIPNEPHPQTTITPIPMPQTKSQTPRPSPSTSRPNVTNTPPVQATPPPSRHSSRNDNSSSSSSADKFNLAAQMSALSGLANNPAAAAAAMQAFQQQVFRGLQGLSGSNNANLQAQMMQFSPLLYSYQVAMAQAMAANKGNNLNELQRLLELHRQYLIEMMPQASSSNRQNNWKS